MSGTRSCAGCGRLIEVPANNPHKRYCSPRCRVADWHHHHDRRIGATDTGEDAHHAAAANGAAGAEAPNDVPTHNAVPAPNVVANAVPTGGASPADAAAPRCPHCRQPVTVLSLLLPPAAAHVTVPGANPGR